MRTMWPAFRLRKHDRMALQAMWLGTFRPQYTWYTIEIQHRMDWPNEYGLNSEVRILSPELKRLPGNSEGDLPHVYAPNDRPPFLCLYDTRTKEWDQSMILAETIVPWTFDWVACYEHWLVTGRWFGGGRHSTDPVPATETMQ